MCGIAGFLDVRAETSRDELVRQATLMSDALQHRGPDDSGSWADAVTGIALGFRRLAIIDLTQAGHQPMQSVSGRFTLVFNGEIYNHHDLRSELGGYPYRGHSDTEVMLAAFERWGVEASTRRFNGMFAFAVWDGSRRVLTLGRDRLGEKPLYYGLVGRRLAFASELKAIRALPGFGADLDRDALALFVRHGYIPAPHSVYRGICKLPPAHLLEIDGGNVAPPFPYWSALDAARGGLREPLTADPEALESQLQELLLDSVRTRMESDVPLGAFLSGGIDSSLIVALMQAQSSQPVRTFTIGFTEPEYDEAAHAKAVAAHLGTAHTELYVTPQEAQQVIPLLPSMYDEPFSDSSQIPTYLVSQLARRDVTVSLSGDGGDELFGGYSRYLLLDDLWDRLGRVPLAARRAVASGIERVPAARWDAAFRALGPLLPGRARQQHPGAKLHKLAGGLRHSRVEDVYLQLVSLWSDPSALVLGSREPLTPLTDPAAGLDGVQAALRAMQIDAVTYLPDDILAKVDRAAMAVSLETRVPLLDHRVYEFAWRLPSHLRMQGGEGKRLLRRILQRYVPSDLVDRPKMGFGVPIGSWLRGPLRDWAEDLLDERRLAEDGLLDVRTVRATWEAHRAGAADEKYRLWSVLMLQAWLRAQPA